MRFIVTIILISCVFYWLSAAGVVSFDNIRAKYYISEVCEKVRDWAFHKMLSITSSSGASSAVLSGPG